MTSAPSEGHHAPGLTECKELTRHGTVATLCSIPRTHQRFQGLTFENQATTKIHSHVPVRERPDNGVGSPSGLSLSREKRVEQCVSVAWEVLILNDCEPSVVAQRQARALCRMPRSLGIQSRSCLPMCVCGALRYRTKQQSCIKITTKQDPM